MWAWSCTLTRPKYYNIQRRKPKQQPEHTHVNDMAIEILPYGASQKYLGRALTFRTPTEAEVNNRTSVAWRKFYALKQELTTKSYSLKGRLRLFHGTITPTILYGSSAWTLTTALQNKIRRTQRQMLRMILHCPRRRQAPNNNQTPPIQNPQDQSHPDSGNTTDTDEDPNDVDSNPHNDDSHQPLQPDGRVTGTMG